MTRDTDHFSQYSGDYAQYRPGYPEELFSLLARECAHHELAWDCGTGNGQAARALARHFERVLATDLSREQISAATGADNITWRAAPAEESGLPAQGTDLITVAQALHWFDLDAFFDEARRVLRPGGLLAVWSYGLAEITPEVDAVIRELYHNRVGPWWPPERAMVEDGYASIRMPFPELDVPALHMSRSWNLSELVGYLRTWSAVQRFLKERGEDPVFTLEAALERAWGDPGNRHTVRWPLSLRVARRP